MDDVNIYEMFMAQWAAELEATGSQSGRFIAAELHRRMAAARDAIKARRVGRQEPSRPEPS